MDCRSHVNYSLHNLLLCNRIPYQQMVWRIVYMNSMSNSNPPIKVTNELLKENINFYSTADIATTFMKTLKTL